MQVCVDVTCMCTNFGGCGLSGFGDTTTLKNGQISLLDHGGQKIESAKKIHASRGWRGMHANQFRWVGPSSVSEILHFLQRQASTVGGRVAKQLIHILGIKLLNIKSQLPCALCILVLYFSAIAITIIIIMKNCV